MAAIQTRFILRSNILLSFAILFDLDYPVLFWTISLSMVLIYSIEKLFKTSFYVCMSVCFTFFYYFIFSRCSAKLFAYILFF